MTKYYTVTTPRTGKDGKPRFHKEVAFPQNEGAKSFMTIQHIAALWMNREDADFPDLQAISLK